MANPREDASRCLIYREVQEVKQEIFLADGDNFVRKIQMQQRVETILLLPPKRRKELPIEDAILIEE